MSCCHSDSHSLNFQPRSEHQHGLIQDLWLAFALFNVWWVSVAVFVCQVVQPRGWARLLLHIWGDTTLTALPNVFVVLFATHTNSQQPRCASVSGFKVPWLTCESEGLFEWLILVLWWFHFFKVQAWKVSPRIYFGIPRLPWPTKRLAKRKAA